MLTDKELDKKIKEFRKEMRLLRIKSFCDDVLRATVITGLVSAAVAGCSWIYCTGAKHISYGLIVQGVNLEQGERASDWDARADVALGLGICSVSVVAGAGIVAGISKIGRD